VVFSVGEAESQELYRRAAARAWAMIEARREELSLPNQARKFQLVEVSYDPLPGESVIEELPDPPKSSRPKAVEVAVLVRATYALR
jgi:hypothetical protein